MGWLQPFYLMVDIFTLTQQALIGMDIELVDVERAPAGLLRITIDRLEGVRIEDCEQVSRQLSRVFAVEDVDYRRLEVGSPGLDRPLRTLRDFLRFDGERVEVRLREALDNRKTFVGVLRSHPLQEEVSAAANGGEPTAFGLELDGNEATVLNFTLADVEHAKLNPILNFKGKKR